MIIAGTAYPQKSNMKVLQGIWKGAALYKKIEGVRDLPCGGKPIQLPRYRLEWGITLIKEFVGFPDNRRPA